MCSGERHEADGDESNSNSNEDSNELNDPNPDAMEVVEFSSEFRMPAHIYDSLFDFQRTAVSWLYGLHRRNAGGILGDEMVTDTRAQRDMRGLPNLERG